MMFANKWLGFLFLILTGGYGAMEAQPGTQTTARADSSALSANDGNIERKALECKRLTNNGIKHFMKKSVENACNDFIHDTIWRKGELFVFVFDAQGVVLAHGDDTDLIWKNIKM